ncbi:MAG: 23S rRNA (adenine(2503)-C(2))-methyltransferase RlmN, partial [Alphaproteobacteria bacterium]
MNELAPQLADFLPGGVLAAAADPRPNLVGMDRDDMAAALAPLGVEPYRVRQIFQWVYNRGVTSFDAMTNLSKALRAELETRFRIARLEVSDGRISTDGTRKWLVRFPDRQEAETVFIPEPDRGTLCVSSQIGCTLTCSFCHTGTQKLVRNLTADEILGQLMLARDALGEWPDSQVDRKLTNIVMMGMGEPLFNFDNVKKALRIAVDGEGISISWRKITLSTSG